jgi:hypothetical protein
MDSTMPFVALHHAHSTDTQRNKHTTRLYQPYTHTNEYATEICNKMVHCSRVPSPPKSLAVSANENFSLEGAAAGVEKIAAEQENVVSTASAHSHE